MDDPLDSLEALPIAAADGTIRQSQLFADDVAAARDYAEASRASATRRAYAADWRIFTAWCHDRSVSACPAEPALVAVFLAAEAARGAKPATITRRLAAIGYHHKRGQYPAPTQVPGAIAITEVMAGIRRTHGVAPIRKRAADGDILRDLLRTIDGDGLRAHRDRALLAIGMAGSMRRSELVALATGDVLFEADGLKLRIARGKTDQVGAGATIAIPAGRRIRPVALLRAWLDCAGHSDGPLFRRLTRQDILTNDAMSDRSIARLVQGCAAAAGHDPREFAGHSLRAGFLTEAARQGASVFKMREVSRHKSVQVLSDYVRDAELFRDHAGEGFL